MIDTVFKYVSGIVKLRGATDATPIGNNGDKLKVDGSEVIQPIVLKEGFLVSGESLAVPSASETVVASYTVPVGETYRLERAHARADGDTHFRLKKNGAQIAARDNNWCARTVTFEYGSLLFQAGDIISITAEHNCSNPLDIGAELYGN